MSCILRTASSADDCQMPRMGLLHIMTRMEAGSSETRCCSALSADNCQRPSGPRSRGGLHGGGLVRNALVPEPVLRLAPGTRPRGARVSRAPPATACSFRDALLEEEAPSTASVADALIASLPGNRLACRNYPEECRPAIKKIPAVHQCHRTSGSIVTRWQHHAESCALP